MSDEGFLRRWSRRKAQVARGEAPVPEPVPEAEPALDAAPPVLPAAELQPAQAQQQPAERIQPTLDDVARLTPDADFSSFVTRDVDPAVRRGALKKLFADPHFNAMDGLDVYIDDYTKPSPVSEAMLASLAHARSVFARPAVQEPEPEAAPIGTVPVVAEVQAEVEAAPEPGAEPTAINPEATVATAATTTPEDETP